MVVIHNLAKIPRFDSEVEEATFWDSHEFSDGMLASFPSTPAHLLPPTRPHQLAATRILRAKGGSKKQRVKA